MKILIRALSVVLAILVPALLVLSAARLIMTETYLNFEYHRPDFPPDRYGFTLEDRLHYGPYALRYVFNGEGIDYLAQLTLPNGLPLYSSNELSHLADVKNVVRAIFGTLAVLWAVVIMLIVGLWRRDPGVVWVALLSGATLTLLSLGALTFFVLTSWDSFFDQFHELFFPGGNWIFDFSDDLIRLYPVQFWQDSALTLGLLTAIAATLILILSFWRLRRKARLS
jgi:integral membrane protein (TIGR01906 family)